MVTENCPLCENPPEITLGPIGFCGNEECKILAWDREKTVDELLEKVHFISLEN